MSAPHTTARAPDKRRPSNAPATIVSTAPPVTPPMIDPSTFRHPRLTPNLREMIQGFNQGAADSNASMQDLFASPDPNAMYNSMQIGSPILHDLYTSQSPIQGSTVPYDSPDIFAERAERISGAAAEMNALFNNYPTKSIDATYQENPNQSCGVMSLMSSPELKEGGMDVSRSGVSSSHQKKHCQTGYGQKFSQGSQSPSQTPPPVDDISWSPADSPEFVVKSELSKKRVQAVSTSASSQGKADQTREKQVQETSQARRIVKKEASAVAPNTKSYTRSTSATASGLGTTSDTAPHGQQGTGTGGQVAAVRAMAISAGMGGLIPFACAMPGMGTMLQMPGALHCQGRPMAFVNGVHGTELIPVDMLAQATALQYGVAVAQAAANRMVQSEGESEMTECAPLTPFDVVGGSRKKRRRQLLERSGCSEEQARQNRAHALKRLRQKKTLRTQQSTVRYACRKRIAMVRPRVNGRFATKDEVKECQRTD